MDSGKYTHIATDAVCARIGKITEISFKFPIIQKQQFVIKFLFYDSFKRSTCHHNSKQHFLDLLDLFELSAKFQPFQSNNKR